MFYKTLRLSIFWLFLHHLSAQSGVWNHELPIKNALSPSNCQVQWIGGKYLFCAQKSLVELTQEGLMVNFMAPPSSEALSFGSFFAVRKDALTGKRYFVMAYRPTGVQTPLYFAEFRPGTGLVLETPFDETLNNKSYSPAILEMNDSTFVVFGKKAIRKIVHRPGEGFVQKWEKPLNMASVQGVQRNQDGFIAVSQGGKISGFDGQGNELWTQTTAYSLNNIQTAPDGFVVCGDKGISRRAVVLKLNNSGLIQWQKEYDAYAFDGLVVLADQRIAVSGQSNAGTIVLAKLNADGELIWRMAYQKGRGNFLMSTVDAGFLIAGLSSATGDNLFGVLKTNEKGNTSDVTHIPDFRFRTLENQQTRAEVKPSGALFWKEEAFQTTLLIPKTQKASIYPLTGLFIDGYDDNKVAHESEATYGLSGETDYRPGMVNAPDIDFYHSWYVNRKQLESLRQDWSDNGHLDLEVPLDILTWPARGNPNFGPNLDFSEATTDRMLLPAPFVDANGDGIYNVSDGDYPLLKGDQMTWFVMTDNVAHTQSNGIPLLCDISVCAYLFDCPADPLLETTVFVDYTLINRSFNRYTNVYVRLWQDPDLGCSSDDYVGSLPASNAYYLYNQDEMDGGSNSTSPCSGTPTFETNIPVGAVQFLNTSLDAFVSADDFPAPGMIYPDNPADPNGVSLCTANEVNKDWRTMASHGPFVFEPNDTFRLNVAFSYHPNVPLPCPDIFGLVKPRIGRLQELVKSGTLDKPPHLMPIVEVQSGQSALLDATMPGATAYLWSTGSTAAQLNVKEAGVYTVIITRVTGCPIVETVTVRLTTYAVEANQVDDFRLFPNPNKGQFQVELRGKACSQVDFTLFNAVGQVVRTDRVGFGSGVLSKAMDYGVLPAGVYTLNARISGQVYSKKLVVLEQ